MWSFNVYFATMNIYQFETKEDDEDFLAGKPVICKVAMEKMPDGLHPGDKIVIQLSKRAKYMGRVVSFQSVIEEKVVIGEVTVINEAGYGASTNVKWRISRYQIRNASLGSLLLFSVLKLR